VRIIALVLALACTGAASANLGRFGTYSHVGVEKRWAKMCRGELRYQAMLEAHDAGQRNPCGPPLNVRFE
jgi:hypothetical protein